MPKDDSFYEDHTNRLWASWERANALDFYDSEEEERHEQELQALRDQELREQRAKRELEQERMRRWQLLHPPKPPPSSDEEDLVFSNVGLVLTGGLRRTAAGGRRTC